MAIAEGRAAGRVDAHLTGRDLLPCPIQPTDAPSPKQAYLAIAHLQLPGLL